MIPARLPDNERERLNILNALRILDTPPSERLDRITRLAAEFFHVPVALVTLIDKDRQWFKSCFGLHLHETPRDISVCSHAILQNSTLVVPDLRKDPRFHDIPPVVDDPHLVFYAGCQIHSREGVALGTLCIIDTKPRSFSDKDVNNLSDFAKLVEQYFHSLQESTYTKTVEDTLSTTESMFEQTFNQAAVGMASVALNGEWLRVNPKLCALLGYRENELLHKTFQEITHPDDLESDLHMMQEILAGKVETYSIEKRYINSQESAFWILLTVSLVKNRQGEPHHFIAVIVDIDERVAAQTELRKLTNELEARVKQRTVQLENTLHLIHEEVEQRIEAETLLNIEKERLKEITDNVPALISCVSHNLHYTFSNKTYEDWFGFSAVGKYMPEVIGEESFKRSKAYLSRVIDGQRVAFENKLMTRQGIKHVQTTLIPHNDREQSEFYILSLDITELKQLQETLIFEASHDILTGLPNRRSFLNTLNAYLQDGDMHPWIGLFFLDLDGFKQFNDVYGHDFGDRVLKNVATIVSGAVRLEDIPARLAGDEFTILLTHPDNPIEVAKTISQRLLKKLAEQREINGIPVRLSLSIGIVIARNTQNLTPEALLSSADKAMYRAKQEGKGTYHIELVDD
ncbi:diguanylate cyclase domain-containing protein [Leminorella grimontii]|uniref:diguanylate cyclase domain-containing protein n=1 Tax=Leminorella grimontii TaxID=82981 RepID=UPI00321F8414